MQGTSLAPLTRTGEPSITATTIWDRSAGSRIRKETMSISIMMRRDAGSPISTGTGMWSAPFTTWTAACLTRGSRAGREETFTTWTAVCATRGSKSGREDPLLSTGTQNIQIEQSWHNKNAKEWLMQEMQ